MIFAKSLLYKLLLITLALCCLHSVYAGKLPKTKSNSTEIEPAKSVVLTTTEATTEKSSTEEADDDDDDDEGDEDEPVAEKNALKPADDTSVSVWGIVRGVWNWIKEDLSESLFGDDSTTSAVGEGRTFGKIRRMQMALIPIIFKFGVLTAMVAFLVLLALKTLFLVKMLFLLNAVAILGKFFTLKTNFGHIEHIAAPAPSWSWSPHVSSGWQSEPVSSGWHSAPVEHTAAHPSKEIHLHIHGAQAQPVVSAHSSYGNGQSVHSSSGWERRNDPYSAYETLVSQAPQSVGQNKLTSNEAVSGQQTNSNYPSNHRMF